MLLKPMDIGLDLRDVHRTRRVAYATIASAPIIAVAASYLFGTLFTESPNAGIHIYLSPWLMVGLALLHALLAVILFRISLPLFENVSGRNSLGMLFRYIAQTNLLLVLSGALIVGIAAGAVATGSVLGSMKFAVTLGPNLLLGMEGFVLILGTVIGCFFDSYLRTRRLSTRQLNEFSRTSIRGAR